MISSLFAFQFPLHDYCIESSVVVFRLKVAVFFDDRPV